MDESAFKRGILSKYPEQRGYAECQESLSEKPDARAVPRKNLFLAATLYHGAANSPVKVRNLSERGALIEADVLPAVGQSVTLIRGSLAIEGRVIWSDTKYCGVAFASIVSMTAWIAPPGNAEQRRVDQNIAMVRSGITPASIGAVTPALMASRTSDSVNGQLLDDLGMAVRLLTDLGDDLITHPGTVAAHGTKLQNIDLASQVLTAIARVMAAQKAGEPASLAQLNDLRVSCSEALRTTSGS